MPRKKKNSAAILGIPEFIAPEFIDLERSYNRAESRRNDSIEVPSAANGWTLDDAWELEQILTELDRRQAEALSVYRPVPGMVDFHRSRAGERGVIGSNRAGKTLGCGAEVARIVTGRHPDVERFPEKNGDWGIVGPKLDHIRLLYYTLFKPGQFKILRTDSGWVVPNFVTPEHVARIKEWEPAGPLIPQRMIEDIAWENAKMEVPSIIKLINGWALHFFSFESEPERGTAYNGFWMDEEHPRAKYWLSEIRARLMSRKGYLIWSATPESATPTFYGLKSRANRPDMATKPPYMQTKFYSIHSKDNPYLDPEAREALFERLTEDDPEAAVAKVEGDWAFKKYLVYPEFEEERHVIEPFDIRWNDTVHVILDPSRTRCAMLLAAILADDHPHYLPEQPDRIVIFDEIVIKNCNAFKAARELHRVMTGYKHWIESIVIDWQQGRKKDESEKQIAEYYWEEFQNIGICPRVNEFVKGSSNLEGGIETVSQFLDPKDKLPPKFVMMRGRTQWLAWEFMRYHRKKNPDGSPGTPIVKNNDLVDCARYACQAGFTWVTPPSAVMNANHYTADELKAIDRNPRLWFYKATMPDMIRSARK